MMLAKQKSRRKEDVLIERPQLSIIAELVASVLFALD